VNLKAARALCERNGLTYVRSLVLTNLMELALKAGDLESAQAHAPGALESAAAAGNRAVESWVRTMLARIALLRGELAAARADLRAALEVALAIGRPSLLSECVSTFADLLAAQGEPDCARRVRDLAAGHPATGPEMSELANRIVVETPVSHAPLIASMRASG
jgi:ATP/maltotriose-dependent transcriptional regulator MalT